AALVIVVALRVLAHAPNLWRAYNTDDNLLFRRTDFVSPDTSALFRDLRAEPATRDVADRFARVCQSEYALVPVAADFLQLKVQTTPSAATRQPAAAPPKPAAAPAKPAAARTNMPAAAPNLAAAPRQMAPTLRI